MHLPTSLCDWLLLPSLVFPARRQLELVSLDLYQCSDVSEFQYQQRSLSSIEALAVYPKQLFNKSDVASTVGHTHIFTALWRYN